MTVSIKLNQKGGKSFDFWLAQNDYDPVEPMCDHIAQLKEDIEDIGFVLTKVGIAEDHTPRLVFKHEDGRNVELWAIYYNATKGSDHTTEVRTFLRGAYPDQISEEPG